MSKKKGSPPKQAGKERSNAPTQKKRRKRRKKSRGFGAPMVATGGSGIPYTYPTGNSEDY